MQKESLPEGVVTQDGHRYLLIPLGLTWEQAKSFCSQIGGHLVTVTSEEELDFLIDSFKGTVGRFWVGGYRTPADEASWKWISGEPWDFEPWSPRPAAGTRCPAYSGLVLADRQLMAVDSDTSILPYVLEWDPEPIDIYRSRIEYAWPDQRPAGELVGDAGLEWA